VKKKEASCLPNLPEDQVFLLVPSSDDSMACVMLRKDARIIRQTASVNVHRENISDLRQTTSSHLVAHPVCGIKWLKMNAICDLNTHIS
jgi:hypothetical protein